MAQQEQVVVVEFLGGTVEKESVCRLKRTFGKFKWRGWEFRASCLCDMTHRGW